MWERDVEVRPHISDGFQSASCARIRARLSAPSNGECAALVALGWFARERIANWPSVQQKAVDQTPTLDEVYQIGLAPYWLHGLDRWESKPAPFSAGEWFLGDRLE